MSPASSRISLASSATRVEASRIRRIAELAMTMDGVLKLYFGESNLPTPSFICDAAKTAIDEGYTYYTSNAGMPSTREAIARYYSTVQNVSVDPDNVVVTASGVQGLNVGIRCLLDPGDEAIVLTPNWPNASAIAQMCNAVPVEVPLVLAGNRFTVDFEHLERVISPRTRLLVYTSPSNPLGWVATQEEQQKLLEFTRRHGMWLMADEVYERLCYTGGQPGPAATILRLAEPDDAVIAVQSFSKSYCMTGWRLGWLVSRPDLASRAAVFNEFTVTQAASFTQRAGETALDHGEAAIADMLKMYIANRDYVTGRLRAMPGVSAPDPEGAFYIFPRIDGLKDSLQFCRDLLLETKVGLAPGVAFGNGGEGSVRICYASELPVLQEAMDRLEQYLATCGGVHTASQKPVKPV